MYNLSHILRGLQVQKKHCMYHYTELCLMLFVRKHLQKIGMTHLGWRRMEEYMPIQLV